MGRSEHPLTPNQQGLLFHCLSEQGDRPYFIQNVFEVHEDLEVDALRQAWRQVVARHDILRCSFRWERVASPQFVVYDQIETPIAVTSLAKGSPDLEAARLEQYLAEDRNTGFDFRQAPLHRLHALEVGPSRWWVVLTISHAICDADTQRVLEDELLELYGAIRSGSAVDLPRSPAFGAFAQWLQSRDKSDALLRSEERRVGKECRSRWSACH